MKRRFQAVKGTRDILPPESALWQRVEQTAREVLGAYNYREIRLPLFEETEVFARSVGADTDIVSKEMYTFSPPSDRFAELQQEWRALRTKARSDAEQGRFEEVGRLALDETERFESLSLRPEATASVVRAYIEHGLYQQPGLTKLYYIGPMFRRERPQKGRYRQFYQVGAEALGKSDHPAIDAEVIEMVLEFIERCGLKGAKLHVNSLGCPVCRPQYVELLGRELEKVREKLGPDSYRRVDTNPLRVLDSKVEAEQPLIEKLPSILDHLCAGPVLSGREGCREHFEQFQQELKDRGIAYQINRRLVRGLDYYTRTAFEITAPGLGAQDAICGGGRYDGLSELLGGPPTKGIGWALGTDRFLLSLQQTTAPRAGGELDVFIAWLGAAARSQALRLARVLRGKNLCVEIAYEEAKLRKSLELADKLKARYTVIVGEDELQQGKFTLRDMATGQQHLLTQADLLTRLAPPHGH